MLDNFRHLHFIGIGGSGLSALAYLAQDKGLKVSGSDSAESTVTKALEAEGIPVHLGHRAGNLSPLTELVLYSEAINKLSNPEYQAAIAKNLPTMSYFEALGELSKHKKTIVVTGTHGKTTTTAMLGEALIEAGEDPTVIVGSRVPAFNGRNLHVGKSEWLVAEACEYKRSFLSFEPFGMVLLNCELEHVDYYKDEADYVEAFKELARKIPKEGFLVYNAQDPNAQEVAKVCSGKALAVSGKMVKELAVPGEFNEWNASLAQKAALQVSDKKNLIAKSLQAFKGTARRMEIKGEKAGVIVIDDYAHHPTEIRSTLGALREKYPKQRLICVFQPHQYSRTHALLKEFKGAFSAADQVIVPDIFEARDSEEDKKKISAESFCRALSDSGTQALWTNGTENTVKWLTDNTKSGDLVITMGAGDVYKIGEALISVALPQSL